MPATLLAPSRLARHLAVIAAVVLAALVAPAAPGQGTSGTLPDPIASQELARWLGRFVSPTPAQWEAIDALHGTYKEEFSRLREGDIAKFLEESKSLQGGIPDRAKLKKFVDRWEALRGRIKGVDGRFFDGVQATLGETQAPAMARVRLARERAVGRGNQMMMGMAGGIPVDLSEMVAGLDLEAADLAAVDADLVTYEQQSTRRLTALGDSGMTMIVDLVDSLAAAGFGDMTNEELMADPEKMKGMMEAMQAAFRESGRKGREQAAELAELNNKTRRAVAAKLPPEAAQRLRKEYIAKAYPGAVGNESTERALRAGLRLKAIDDGQRAALQGVLDGWLRQDEKFEEEQIDHEDRTRLESSPFDFATEAGNQQREATEALREKRRAADRAAVASAAGIVGPELGPKLETIAIGGSVGSGDFVDEGGPGGAGGVQVGAAETAPAPPRPGVAANGGDAFVPAQIGVGDVAAWARRLALDDGRKAILESLHTDYLESWQKEVGPLVAAISTAQQAAFARQDDGAGNMSVRTDPAGLDKVYAARQAARAGVVRLEAALFEDIRQAVADPGQAVLVDAIAVGRGGRVTGQAFMGMFSESSEAELDLAEVLDEAVSDEHFAAIAAPALVEKGPALRGATEELTRRMLENQLAMERFGATMQEQGAEERMDAMVKLQTELAAMGKRVDEASTARREIVRGLLESISSKLPPDEATTLANAFNKAAFPQIYKDDRSAALFLDRAHDLGSLTDAQLAQVEALRAEYEPAYADHCARMVAIAREGGQAMGNDPEAWQRWQERRNQLDRIRFDRNELSSRTVRRLGVLLGPELAAQLPGYTQYMKPQEDDGNPFR